MSTDPGAAVAQTKRVPPWRRALPWIGVVLLVVVLSRLDLRAMGRVLLDAPWWGLAAGAGAFALNVGVKSVRWQRMLVAQRIHLPWRLAFIGFFLGSFYGAVTVGRVGELLRTELLTARGVPLGRALASSIADRVLDLAILVAIGGVFGAMQFGDRRIAYASLLGLAVGVPVLWGLVHRAAAWARRRMAVDGGHDVRRGLRGKLHELLIEAPTFLRPRVFVEELAWSALAWLAYFANVWVVARALGIAAPKLLLTLATAFSALSSLLPITYQGVGVRELIFARALASVQVPTERAVLLGLTVFALMLVTTVVLGLLAMLVRRRAEARFSDAAASHEVQLDPS